MTVFRGRRTGITHLGGDLCGNADGTATGYGDVGTVCHGQCAVGRGLGIAVLHIAGRGGVEGAVRIKGSQQGHAGGDGVVTGRQRTTCGKNDNFTGCSVGSGNSIIQTLIKIRLASCQKPRFLGSLREYCRYGSITGGDVGKTGGSRNHGVVFSVDPADETCTGDGGCRKGSTGGIYLNGVPGSYGGAANRHTAITVVVHHHICVAGNF